MKRLAVLAWLLIATCAVGQAVPLEISGDTVTVVRTLPCKVTAPAGADVYIWSHPSSIKSSEDDNVLTITAAPAGEVVIKVQTLTVDWAAKKTIRARGTITLVVGKLPDPGPGPPDPLLPDDPLLGGLRAAYGADTSATKEADARKLAAVWRSAAGEDFLKKAGTWRNLLSDMSAAAEAQLPGRLKPIRSALSAELKSLVPDLESKVTNGGGEAARKILLRFAGLLDSLTTKRGK